jgi:hypothetical protein
VVLVALRQYGFDGRKGSGKFRDLVSTNASVVVASRTKDGIAQADQLAIVPYGDGELMLKRAGGVSAEITEHYFRGGKSTQQIPISSGVLRVPLHEKGDDGTIVEWYEVDIR